MDLSSRLGFEQPVVHELGTGSCTRNVDKPKAISRDPHPSGKVVDTSPTGCIFTFHLQSIIMGIHDPWSQSALVGYHDPWSFDYSFNIR